MYVLNSVAGVYSSAPGSVLVVDGASAVANVTVGADPDGLVYDPGNGFVYVQNLLSDNVSVLNGTNLLATISVGWENFTPPLWGVTLGSLYPYGGYPAYDPINGFVYVPNDGNDTVTIINGTAVVATVPVGSIPVYANFDRSDGFVYITNVNDDCYPGTCSGTSNVTVLNGTTVVGSVGVGIFPISPAVGSNGELYVPNHGSCDVYGAPSDCDSANVTVINGTTSVANISVGFQPVAATADLANGFVYVSHYTGNSSDIVTVINGTSVRFFRVSGG